jgi:Mrp family chromosome partitioning ATPase
VANLPPRDQREAGSVLRPSYHSWQQEMSGTGSAAHQVIARIRTTRHREPAPAGQMQGSRPVIALRTGERTMQKITVLNQKGGVGKTTVSVNLAYGLARAGKRTLLIDLDPQAHSTTIYCQGVPKDATIGAVFENRKTDLAALVRLAEVKGQPSENLWIIPSNIHRR